MAVTRKLHTTAKISLVQYLNGFPERFLLIAEVCESLLSENFVSSGSAAGGDFSGASCPLRVV